MVICIPVSKDDGLKSPVSSHFGSAPFFMLVNTELHTHRTVANRNLHHSHGQCQPLAAIQGEAVDAVVVGGIGAGALAKIQAAGVEVLWSDLLTVEETLQALGGPGLQSIDPAQTCERHHAREGQGHAGMGGCSH